VFYIHPTTYLSVFHDNGRTDETGLASTVLKGVLRYQASVFNDCCRIFMPHYRQASIKRIIGTSDAAIKATDLAYSDVVNAFDYYMAHENHGRPFLLASHSQGSSHALRLLQERIIGTPLQTRMIAAYALGGTLPTAIKEKGLPICDSPTMAGCLIGWNTVDKGHEDSWRMKKSLIWWDGHYQPIAGRPRICVNPLNWKKDGAEEASENLGSAYDTGKDKPAVAIVAHATSAACKNGFLEIDLRSDQRSNYRDILSVFGNYHDFDYSVFYMNIRYNVALRIKAYFKSNPVN
jgi:hypothetical protein